LKKNLVNIICVLRYNDKSPYDESWVEKLYNGINRNTSIPFDFYCLTDMHPTVGERIQLHSYGQSWWSKIQLFRQGLFRGHRFYFDLDTVICGNLDEIFEKCMTQQYFLMTKGRTGNPSSAFMYWNKDYGEVYEKYIKKRKQIEEKYKKLAHKVGDQGYIQDSIKHKLIQNILPNGSIDYFGNPKLDREKIRMLMFANKKNKPHICIDPLIKEHW